MVKATSKETVKSILVIAPAWIGDMVMAQTLFKFLKSRDPTVAIDVLAPSWALPLVERMPEVRNSILLPFVHGELKLCKRYTFAKNLRQFNYDQAIVLPGSFKSALIAFWAKIPKRTGWLGEWRFGVLNDYRKLNKEQFPLMIQRFAALGLPKSISLTQQLEPYYPSLSVNKNNLQSVLDRFNLTTSRPILALCPGAEYGPAKRWPIKSFANVAGAMINKGWQVFIFGSKKDSELAKALMVATNNQCQDLTGKTSLIEAVDLLSLATGIISNDSGLMHIAASLGRPLVVLYGSSTPSFTPPLTKRVKIIHLNLPCSPCFKRHCPLGHFDCMNQITPDRVLTQLDSLMTDDQSLSN